MRKRRLKRSNVPSMLRLATEASAVVALRLGLLAFGVAPKGEARRMAAEKPPAFGRAAKAATRAAVSHPFDPAKQIAAASAAWSGSLTRKVRANRKRLTGIRRRKA
jgi:hypothetical protein